MGGRGGSKATHASRISLEELRTWPALSNSDAMTEMLPKEMVDDIPHLSELDPLPNDPKSHRWSIRDRFYLRLTDPEPARTNWMSVLGDAIWDMEGERRLVVVSVGRRDQGPTGKNALEDLPSRYVLARYYYSSRGGETNGHTEEDGHDMEEINTRDQGSSRKKGRVSTVHGYDFKTQIVCLGHPLRGRIFRSIPEFMPHFVFLTLKNSRTGALRNRVADGWILTADDDVSDFADCRCGNCTRLRVELNKLGEMMIRPPLDHTLRGSRRPNKASTEKCPNPVFRKDEVVWVYLRNGLPATMGNLGTKIVMDQRKVVQPWRSNHKRFADTEHTGHVWPCRIVSSFIFQGQIMDSSRASMEKRLEEWKQKVHSSCKNPSLNRHQTPADIDLTEHPYSIYLVQLLGNGNAVFATMSSMLPFTRLHPEFVGLHGEEDLRSAVALSMKEQRKVALGRALAQSGTPRNKIVRYHITQQQRDRYTGSQRQYESLRFGVERIQLKDLLRIDLNSATDLLKLVRFDETHEEETRPRYILAVKSIFICGTSDNTSWEDVCLSGDVFKQLPHPFQCTLSNLYNTVIPGYGILPSEIVVPLSAVKGRYYALKLSSYVSSLPSTFVASQYVHPGPESIIREHDFNLDLSLKMEKSAQERIKLERQILERKCWQLCEMDANLEGGPESSNEAARKVNSHSDLTTRSSTHRRPELQGEDCIAISDNIDDACDLESAADGSDSIELELVATDDDVHEQSRETESTSSPFRQEMRTSSVLTSSPLRESASKDQSYEFSAELVEISDDGGCSSREGTEDETDKIGPGQLAIVLRAVMFSKHIKNLNDPRSDETPLLTFLGNVERLLSSECSNIDPLEVILNVHAHFYLAESYTSSSGQAAIRSVAASKLRSVLNKAWGSAGLGDAPKFSEKKIERRAKRLRRKNETLTAWESKSPKKSKGIFVFKREISATIGMHNGKTVAQSPEQLKQKQSRSNEERCNIQRPLVDFEPGGDEDPDITSLRETSSDKRRQNRKRRAPPSAEPPPVHKSQHRKLQPSRIPAALEPPERDRGTNGGQNTQRIRSVSREGETGAPKRRTRRPSVTADCPSAEANQVNNNNMLQRNEMWSSGHKRGRKKNCSSDDANTAVEIIWEHESTSPKEPECTSARRDHRVSTEGPPVEEDDVLEQEATLLSGHKRHRKKKPSEDDANSEVEMIEDEESTSKEPHVASANDTPKKRKRRPSASTEVLTLEVNAQSDRFEKEAMLSSGHERRRAKKRAAGDSNAEVEIIEEHESTPSKEPESTSKTRSRTLGLEPQLHSRKRSQSINRRKGERDEVGNVEATRRSPPGKIPADGPEAVRSNPTQQSQHPSPRPKRPKTKKKRQCSGREQNGYGGDGNPVSAPDSIIRDAQHSEKQQQRKGKRPTKPKRDEWRPEPIRYGGRRHRDDSDSSHRKLRDAWRPEPSRYSRQKSSSRSNARRTAVRSSVFEEAMEWVERSESGRGNVVVLLVPPDRFAEGGPFRASVMR